MSTALEILGALGGGTAFVTLCIVTLRAIFKQVNATNDNTDAVGKLTKSVDDLSAKFSGHETRITILEDHDKNRRNVVRP